MGLCYSKQLCQINETLKGLDRRLVELERFHDRRFAPNANPVINERILSGRENRSFATLEKPNIYIYYPGEIKITLDVAKADLIYAYPVNYESNNKSISWTIEDPSSVRYLFWEARGIIANDYGDHNVSVVMKKDVESYLTQITDKFTEAERTDFITYWAPRLLKHDTVTARVYTHGENLPGLHTSPAIPVVRFYLVFKKCTDHTTSDITGVDLIRPADSHIFEWGGTEL